jgi:hypothetical protein
MRKKLLAVVLIVALLAMESVTVFATEVGGTPSPTAQDYLYGDVTTGQTLSGDVVMLNGETNSDLRLYRLRLNSGVITESNDVVIGMIEVGDSGLNELDDIAAYNSSREKLIELAEQAKLDGLDMDGIAFNVTSSEQDMTISFMDSRIEEADNYNGMIKVFHLLSSGEWEEPTFMCQDGMINVHFQNGFSPVLIVKYSKSADYTEKTVTTISGATSPKTSEVDPYAILTVLISIVCIVVCTKKIAKK